jgi:hypothetical protein
MDNRNRDIMDYYGITREEISDSFLKGSREKIMSQALGMIEESKRQLKANNHRLSGLNLSIAQLMIEYIVEMYDREMDYKAANDAD